MFVVDGIIEAEGQFIGPHVTFKIICSIINVLVCLLTKWFMNILRFLHGFVLV